MLPFQITELLCDTGKLDCWLHCTDSAMAERGVRVKDRREMVIVATDRTDLWGSVREILSILLRHWYEKVSGFCAGTYTSSLHKMAVWSEVSPWCSFVEMRMLSLCLENTKSSRWPWLWVGSEMDWTGLGWTCLWCSFLELLFSAFSEWKLKSPLRSVLPVFKKVRKLIEKHGVRESLFLLLDHFYIALLSALEQTHCARMWFYMSE